MNKFVTVVMSVYNCDRYLLQAVQAILDQTFTDFDFYIINDGSTDSTQDILASIKDSRVTLFKSEKNVGLGKALNYLIEKSTAKYIARMDADDICSKYRLEKQIHFIEKNKSISVIGTQLEFFTDFSSRTVKCNLPLFHDEIFKVLVNGGHSLSHPTILFNREIFSKIGGYRIDGVGQDWDLFIRLAEAGLCANLPDFLYQMRFHPLSNAWNSAQKSIIGNDFALFNYKNRKYGKNEISIDHFQSLYYRNKYNFIKLKCKTMSSVFYRKAIMAKLSNNYFSYLINASFASLFNIKKFCIWILKKYKPSK